MKNTVIDLFAGVGGLSLGFEKAGFNVVLANEYDESIAASYKFNHKKTNMIVGDITKLDLEKEFGKYRRKIDVIVGGPPCQGFSQKGQRKTINDERNFLFRYYVSVVRLVQPKMFVMENVPNLLTAENGYFKKEITNLFAELGYTISSAVINAMDYGVPQNRKRAIVIGKIGIKEPKLPEVIFDKTTIWDAISDLAFLDSGEGKDKQEYKSGPLSTYQQMLRGTCEVLYNHKATAHSRIALERMALIPANCDKKVLPKEHRTKSIYSGTWTRMNKDTQSVTITTRFDTPSSGQFTHPYLNRAITVREAARIQSFPDDFVFIGTKSSQMKQVGNAVPPLLAYQIAKTIRKELEND